MGGLGCPVAEFLTRAGIGSLGIIERKWSARCKHIQLPIIIPLKAGINYMGFPTQVEQNAMEMNKKKNSEFKYGYYFSRASC